ncbi:KOW domain-containing RNA-binding protein [Clostridium malenominatum]|uniref:KOW domain-containing RNA-binding protein n=1 Tax=Clostridium malenominatum TaxID=1539 RepID=A0ABP3TQV7_9CLOT
MEDKGQIGTVVYSKAGRDKDKLFIVIDVLDEQYVYIADGTLRLIEKPKKKKIRHLAFTNTKSDEVKNLLISGEKVSNSMIRKILQSHDVNKEV